MKGEMEEKIQSFFIAYFQLKQNKMKKIMNPFAFFMLVCLSALLITGCKDDDDPMMMDPNPVDMETENYELWITDQVVAQNRT